MYCYRSHFARNGIVEMYVIYIFFVPVIDIDLSEVEFKENFNHHLIRFRTETVIKSFYQICSALGVVFLVFFAEG